MTQETMAEENKQQLGFESLACYQQAQKLLRAAYRLAQDLPEYERYNLANQLRRAALSTLLNIAEGYGRYHYLDKLRFFYIARGSLVETLSAFICANQVGYIDAEQLQWIRDIHTHSEKALNGYIGFIRKQKQGADEFGDKFLHEDQAVYHVSISIEGDAGYPLVASHSSPVTPHQ